MSKEILNIIDKLQDIILKLPIKKQSDMLFNELTEIKKRVLKI